MKYAAFDVGNVLVNVDFPSFINKLSKTLNIPIEEAIYFMNRSQKLHDLGLTVMRDELIDHLKIKSSVLRDELIQDWNNCITPADYMIDMLNDLIDKQRLQVALVSNVGLEHAERMASILNKGGFFDKAIKHFSCFVGARKPTLLYYQSFLQIHPEFQGCLYIDDLQENLDTGTKFGFKGHKFDLSDKSTAFDPRFNELKELLSQP